MKRIATALLALALAAATARAAPNDWGKRPHSNDGFDLGLETRTHLRAIGLLERKECDDAAAAVQELIDLDSRWGYSLRARMRLFATCTELDERGGLLDFRRAAELGDWSAAYEIGHAFLDEQLGRPDRAAARQWFRRAAIRELFWREPFDLPPVPDSPDDDVPQEMFEELTWALRFYEQAGADELLALGRAYLNGEGAPADLHAALALLSQAGNRGSVAARYERGRVWALGLPRGTRPTSGVALIERAAREGYAPATLELARRLAVGDLVPRSLEQSYIFYVHARRQGAEVTDEEIATVRDQLSEELRRHAEWALRRMPKPPWIPY